MSHGRPKLPPEISLVGRVALVTGSSRGLGRAIARDLAMKGAHVAINYRSSSEEALSLKHQIVADGGMAEIFGFDVSSAHEVQNGVDAVASSLGALHILVNNAGIAIDSVILRSREQDVRDVLGTNLLGAFNCSKSAARHILKARAAGRIINVSSVVGRMGAQGQSLYAMTKSGVEGMTRSLAREFGPRGVTVNAIAPGLFDTDMTKKSLTEKRREELMTLIPLGVIGDVADIARTAAFLASESARYITGQVIHVNGGMCM